MTREDALFLNWLADRLVNIYKVHERTDYVRRLRQIAEWPDMSNGPDSTLHYEKWVEELWGDSPREDVDRLLGICGMGLPGEAVEFLEELLCGVELIRRAGPMAEAAKKAFRNGKTVDRDKFIDEAGDILYYLVKLLHWQNATLTDAMTVNQLKVNGRWSPLAQESELPVFERETVCSACFFHGAQPECEVCGGEVNYTEVVTVPRELCDKIRKGGV